MKYAFQEYKVTVTNSTEVVSVADVKAALRINCDDDDAYLQMLITAAREMVETATSRVLISSDIEVYQDSFNVESTLNTASIINLFKVPVISVESVEYINPQTTDGDYTTLAADNYQTDIISEPARIYIPSLPSVKSNTMNAVKITYKAGYTTSTIPHPIKQAIMLIVGHWYENRQDVVTGTQVNEIPETSKWLIDRYRLQLFV